MPTTALATGPPKSLILAWLVLLEGERFFLSPT
jgi:hypothetical protein